MATGAAFGQALGIPVYGVCSLDGIGSQTTGDVLVVTDARRREVYWAQYCNGVRIAGPSVNAAADVPRGDAVAVAGSGPQAELFDLPMIGPEYPRPEGLVSAVNDWSQNPPPLLPLYLRRPDAKTLAERARQ
jgi:tRNA A37 threonylcarbamoyladenosine modification protein TsaB